VTILEEELEEIVLHVGDIVVQKATGFVGILVEKFQNRPSGIIGSNLLGDLFFWRIKWLKNINRKIDIAHAPFLNPILEEEGFKMAIFLGNIEHYSNKSFKEVDNEL